MYRVSDRRSPAKCVLHGSASDRALPYTVSLSAPEYGSDRNSDRGRVRAAVLYRDLHLERAERIYSNALCRSNRQFDVERRSDGKLAGRLCVNQCAQISAQSTVEPTRSVSISVHADRSLATAGTLEAS